MNIRWTPQAERDRTAIWLHLMARDPAAAVRIDRAIAENVASLATFPEMGYPGKVAGTRELHPHRSYRLVYEIRCETIWVLVIVHSARQWPPLDA